MQTGQDSPPVTALGRDNRLADGLLAISEAVGSDAEIGRVLDRICTVVAGVVDTDTCSVYLIDEEEPDFLVLAGTHGLSRAEELGIRGFKLGDGFPGWAAANNRTLAIPDARKDPRNHPLDDTRDELRFIAFLCIPLRIVDEVVGVMSVRRADPGEWNREEVVFAEIVARQVSVAIEKSRLIAEKIEAERLAAIAVSLSEVAHTIKNLLGGMAGGSYFVEQGLERKDWGRTRDGWNIFKRNVDKISNLVQNMLMFSREQGCAFEEADLNEIVARATADVHAAAQARGILIDLLADDLAPLLWIDPDAIHDAVLNLVTNAIEAIPPDEPAGRVEVRTRLDLSRVAVFLSVRDNGMGIPDEARQKLYQLFYTTKGRSGTGIGLAVTRKIIEEHGGKLTFDSAVGQGTTFSIEIPILDLSAPQETSQP